MIKHASLCTGIGGFDLAAKSLGWNNIFQVEIDKYCQAVLAKNFPNTKKYEDIIKFKGDDYYEKIDVLSSGFPCQPFSHAGTNKAKGKEDDRFLWYEVLRIIREIKPKCIVLENVIGIVNILLDEVLTDLESEDYKTETVVLPACSIGALHRRKRVWIIAYFDSWGVQRKLDKKIQEFTPFSRWEDVRRAEDFTTMPEVPQPLFRGGYDGVPNWMDRLKSLGNSIVPQLAYIIFSALEEILNPKSINKMEITILSELEKHIDKLTDTQYKQLEQNIIKEGCRDALVIWKYDEKNILIDGHNRYNICIANEIEFKTTEIEFKDIEEAKMWMITNQLGKRNLSPERLSYFRGLLYSTQKHKKGANQHSIGQNVPSIPTAKKIAKENNVSEKTIKRDEQYMNGLNKLCDGRDGGDAIKDKILSGKLKVSKNDIIRLNVLHNREVEYIFNLLELGRNADSVFGDSFHEHVDRVGNIEKLKRHASSLGFLIKEVSNTEFIFFNHDESEKATISYSFRDKKYRLKGEFDSCAFDKLFESSDRLKIEDLKKEVEELSKQGDGLIDKILNNFDNQYNGIEFVKSNETDFYIEDNKEGKKILEVSYTKSFKNR